MTAAAAANKTALILGVANHRSIAWACVERYLRSPEYSRIIVTYQNDRFASTVQKLIAPHHNKVLAVPCNVETELPTLFHERIPQLLQQQHEADCSSTETSSSNCYTLNSIVHSIAYAPPDAMKHGSLLTTTYDAFLQSHSISSYSFLQLVQLALPYCVSDTTNTNDEENTTTPQQQFPSTGITTLSYLGAERAIPNYNIMGPCKASLEALVRGLALECNNNNNNNVRINVVRAGPLVTNSARGGIANFQSMQSHVKDHSLLRRNVLHTEVADAVYYVTNDATYMTGQTFQVDGGYHNVAACG